MHQTPWTKKASSLPSDRIRPSYPNAPPTAKGKGRAQTPEPPKSKEVTKLESLLKALRAASTPVKDPKGGCFCQAREHSLSTYSPICRSCGLILCSINLPQYSCPHCSSPVLNTAIRESLVARLETQITDQIAKEAEGRQRTIDAVRQAAGAFPVLGGGAPVPPTQAAFTPRPMSQTHKVLSLNSKTKKVTLSSYTTTPVPSRPLSRAESVEEEPVRVPPPPSEITVPKARLDPARPWVDLRGGGARYIPPQRLDGEADTAGAGKRRRKNKGKAKENQPGDDTSDLGSAEPR